MFHPNHTAFFPILSVHTLRKTPPPSPFAHDPIIRIQPKLRPRAESKRRRCSGTYQQFNFLIDARSDCLDRATTISSVSRVMVFQIFDGFGCYKFEWVPQVSLNLLIEITLNYQLAMQFLWIPIGITLKSRTSEFDLLAFTCSIPQHIHTILTANNTSIFHEQNENKSRINIWFIYRSPKSHRIKYPNVFVW